MSKSSFSLFYRRSAQRLCCRQLTNSVSSRYSVFLAVPRSPQWRMSRNCFCMDIARNEFCVKPAAALHALHGGVPAEHQPFWKRHSVQWLHSLYVALNATPTKVVAMIEKPQENDPCKRRVYGFLIQFINSMKGDEVANFLRFTTGSSVCSGNLW